MIGSYIALGMLALLGLAALTGFFKGMGRGFAKQLVRLVTTGAALFAAIFSMDFATSYINSMFEGKTLEEVITTYYPAYTTAVDEGIREIISCFDAETARILVLLPIAAIVLPLVFVIAFAILNGIMWIVYWIVTSIIGMTGFKKGMLSRLLGAVIGCAQSVAVTAIMLVPLVGLLGMAGDVKTTLHETEHMNAETLADVDEIYAEYLDEAIASPVTSLIAQFGGEALYSHISSVQVGENVTDSRDSIVTLAAVALDGIGLQDINWNEPSAEDQEALREIVAKIESDKNVATIVAGAIKGASTAVHGGSIEIEVGEPFNAIIDSFFEGFSHTTYQTLHEDLNTLLDFYFILGDSGFIASITGEEADTEAISDLLVAKDENGKTVIDRVIETLKSNERTKPMVSALTQLSVALLCESLGLDEDATQLYEDVKGSVNDVLTMNKSDFETEEEYKEAVSTQLDSALKEHDIELEEEIVNEMANTIAEKYGDRDDITDEDVDEAILSYYDAYQKYLETGDTSGLPEDFPEFD